MTATNGVHHLNGQTTTPSRSALGAGPELPTEETLDPDDWGELRALGHRMLDDMFEHMQTIGERPVWRPVSETSRSALHAPLPTVGQPAEQTYEQFREHVLAYPMGNAHPRFWGWVLGTGTPLGMLSDMLASGMNPNLGGADHAANEVERQVLEWCTQLMGLPAESGGIMTTGGSMANLIGLAVARNERAGYDLRRDGVGASPKPLALYGSAEMHSSLQRAVEVLGLGSRALRTIQVDADYRVDVAALRRAIEADLRDGWQPIAVIGCAGTTNTGSIDPLDELADVAAEYGLWFHVDGAWGAMGMLAPALRARLAGIERADSLAFDLHKWGYLPFEAACALVRDREAHRRAFTLTPSYLKHAERGIAAGELWHSDFDIQLSRGFRALKVWMALQTYGVDKLGRVIQQNVDQAEYLAGRVEESPHLELLAPLALNVVCFRYVARGLDDARLNALNQELLLRLQESGAAAPSGTTLRERYALRCAITNHRTRREDLDFLVTEVERLGAQLVAEGYGTVAVS